MMTTARQILESTSEDMSPRELAQLPRRYPWTTLYITVSMLLITAVSIADAVQ
jgi:hypothetical protein